MPNIKPISDLRNYTEVLREVADGSPVYLTRNGRGEYVVYDIKEVDRMKAMIKLLLNLQKAEQRAAVEGWIDSDEVEAELEDFDEKAQIFAGG